MAYAGEQLNIDNIFDGTPKPEVQPLNSYGVSAEQAEAVRRRLAEERLKTEVTLVPNIGYVAVNSEWARKALAKNQSEQPPISQ